MEKISVIIVNWNVNSSLASCLKSLRDTKYPHIEIIVIDNNSDQKPETVTIQNEKNIGFPKAVNQGLKIATGDLLLLLNPDTRVNKDFFKQALDFFAKYPKAAIMGPKFVNIDGTIQGSVFNEQSIQNTLREFWLGQTGLTEKYAPALTREVFAVSGGCMFITRPAFEKIGFFTEKVFMYYEDLDYCRRAHNLGLKVYYYPELEVIHEHGQSSKKSSKSYQYLVNSSIWYNGFLKHYLMWFISWTGQKFLKRS